MAEEIIVDGELTLGQFLNYEGIVESGGQAKWFLKEYDVYLNGEHEARRGKKLSDGDQLDIPEVGSFIIKFGEQ
ncbi:RNA-binding S4 domain-containing protein [Staphylococcus chromogenes]|uniref:RNA-binding S4 domain-containing protein n=1 Tax=Staphylococcus chromogenes TaxID=46126 RepID=UPI002883D03E|nr:RNA-binding S4 domain-containing protein [Staphylococcus chromogenes]MDT0672135.1 RNA-binding S4 domain-containing protein [Staphylococcus chromogenes]MDT0674284.1 RNA-binding S4 domain-containing protein [Staphylococcus chromogenes]MDT0735814.1 RNA-binding S4 domain-containing protein [Staphylococcus chromogenes]MDT0749439.1 RNA-binding S4 domain-containing protein [Staphylococcus chromogenes]